jgi:D-aminopeptidase
MNATARTTALDAIFAHLDQSDAPGHTVAVVQNGIEIYRTAFGQASIELGVPNAADTRFPIASITKQFTCFAALLLAHDKLLDLSASIRTYLPELSMAHQPVTLRDLMHHTGGVRCFFDLAFFDGQAVPPKGASINMQSRQSALNFEPGTDIMYSNGGYVLLSMAIERAAGQPFETVLAERIFAPLGMTATTCWRDKTRLRPGIATTYAMSRHGHWRHGISPGDEHLGEGNIVSTIDDLLIWAALLRTRDRLADAQTWQTFLAVARLRNGSALDYAAGLFNTHYRGRPMLQHSGGLYGSTSYLLTLPDDELDIVLLSNTLLPVTDLAHRIIDLVLGDRLGPAPMPVNAGPQHDWVGHYIDPKTHSIVEIEEADGLLKLFVQGSGPAPIFQDEHDAGWLAPAIGHVMQIKLGEPGKSLSLTTPAGTSELVRMPKPDPAPSTGSIAGRYVCVDAAATLTIAADDQGKLTASARGRFGYAPLCAEWVAADMIRLTPDFDQLPHVFFARLIGTDVTALELNSAGSGHLRFDRIAQGEDDLHG